MQSIFRDGINPAAIRVSIIDGSAGLRLLIAVMIKARYPDAVIEDIDPYSQTILGAGFALGERGDIIVLGGLGTETEVFSALSRLHRNVNCPPVIVLVSSSLLGARAEFIAAGAFAVLRKDALSAVRMHQFISRAIDKQMFAAPEATPGNVAAETRAHFTATRPGDVETMPTYGEFSFLHEGERHVVAIDGFRFLSNLSSGELAQVFFAEDIETGGNAVIKILTSLQVHNTNAMHAFCKRAALIAKLRSTHIVSTEDAGVTGTFPYGVMEYLSQGDLRRRMLASSNAAVALAIIAQLLDAVSALHVTGYAHADLKPESVFFRPDNSIVLIDFNISKPFGQPVANSKSGSGLNVLGTPTYMSPEQGAGLAIEASADIYSIGIILVEMLMGVPPFTGNTPAQTIYRHIHDEIPLLPPRVRQIQPVLDRMLAKNPSERYQTALLAKDAVERCLADLPESTNS